MATFSRASAQSLQLLPGPGSAIWGLAGRRPPEKPLFQPDKASTEALVPSSLLTEALRTQRPRLLAHHPLRRLRETDQIQVVMDPNPSRMMPQRSRPCQLKWDPTGKATLIPHPR